MKVNPGNDIICVCMLELICGVLRVLNAQERTNVKSGINNDLFLFQLKAADEDKIQETKEKEIESEDEDESSDEQEILLQSRLSQMAIEEGAEDSQEEQQEKCGDERYSPVKFQSNAITSTELASTVVVSSSSTTEDCESCVQERENDSINIQSNTKTLTEREASLFTGSNSTCSDDVVSEQCSEEHAAADALSEDLSTSASGDNEYSGRLLTRDELLAQFKMLHIKNDPNAEDYSQKSLTTVGLVSKNNNKVE